MANHGFLPLLHQVDAQLSEQVELFRLVDSEGLTLLHWAADRGQVLNIVPIKFKF